MLLWGEILEAMLRTRQSILFIFTSDKWRFYCLRVDKMCLQWGYGVLSLFFARCLEDRGVLLCFDNMKVVCKYPDVQKTKIVYHPYY